MSLNEVKVALACGAAAIFLALGIVDFFAHDTWPGIAVICLAVANAIFLIHSP